MFKEVVQKRDSINWGRLNRHIIALFYFIWKIFLLIFTFFIIMVYVYLGWRCWPCFQTERQCWHFTQQRLFLGSSQPIFFLFLLPSCKKKRRKNRKHSFMCCRFEPSKTSSKPARERPSHCDAAPASGYFPASSSCQRLRGGAAPHAPASTSPSRTPLSFHRHSKLHATFGWLLPVARVRWLWKNVENCSGMDVCTAAKSLLLLPSKHAV